jgi:hypothetical protein
MHFSTYLEGSKYRDSRLHGHGTGQYREDFWMDRQCQESGFDSAARRHLSTISNQVETSETKILADLPIGARLLVRSKKDWRSAVISKVIEETVTLIVSSPSGFSYRLRRNLNTKISFDGALPILENPDENWRDNFTKYDYRW